MNTSTGEKAVPSTGYDLTSTMSNTMIFENVIGRDTSNVLDMSRVDHRDSQIGWKEDMKLQKSSVFR